MRDTEPAQNMTLSDMVITCVQVILLTHAIIHLNTGLDKNSIATSYFRAILIKTATYLAIPYTRLEPQNEIYCLESTNQSYLSPL